jgi:hypothetical protein
MYEYDFAISYAGEDRLIAEDIYNKIKEKYGDYLVFLAENEKHQFVGKDGESFFEELFLKSKQVIVIISKHYKQKKWPRFEWDVILERSAENRFIPIKLDDTKIIGLPSNIIYVPYENNSAEIAELAIYKLLKYEKKQEISRKTDFKKTYDSIKNSEGALDKAFQLVKDKRKRTPLANIDYPKSHYKLKYKIVGNKWLNFSVVRRLQLRIQFPNGLSKDEVRFNIKYCVAKEFNKEKPDALAIFAYCKDENFDGFDSMYNVAKADFAPYGKWEEAVEGFVYELPIEKFRLKIEFFEGYFS